MPPAQEPPAEAAHADGLKGDSRTAASQSERTAAPLALRTSPRFDDLWGWASCPCWSGRLWWPVGCMTDPRSCCRRAGLAPAWMRVRRGMSRLGGLSLTGQVYLAEDEQEVAALNLAGRGRPGEPDRVVLQAVPLQVARDHHAAAAGAASIAPLCVIASRPYLSAAAESTRVLVSRLQPPDWPRLRVRLRARVRPGGSARPTWPPPGQPG